MNQFQVSGKISTQGNIPLEIKTAGTQPYLKFDVASRRRGTGNNTDFVSVIAWGAQAEFLKNNANLGDDVVIAGTMRPRNVTVQQNGQNVTMKVNDLYVEFCDHLGARIPRTNFDDTPEFDNELEGVTPIAAAPSVNAKVGRRPLDTTKSNELVNS